MDGCIFSLLLNRLDCRRDFHSHRSSAHVSSAEAARSDAAFVYCCVEIRRMTVFVCGENKAAVGVAGDVSVCAEAVLSGFALHRLCRHQRVCLCVALECKCA